MHTRRVSDASFLTYTELLLKRGLLTEQHGVTNGWYLWQRIKEDPEVRKRSVEMAAKQRPHESPSVHAAHSYGLRVLAAMTPKEIADLKNRLDKGEKEPRA
jgi:hypothetical protein